MQQSQRRNRRAGGFVLLFVVLLSAAIVTTAGTMAMLTEVESRASSRNVKGVQAMAIAYAGLQRGLKAVDKEKTIAVSRLNQLLGGTATVDLDNITFHRWTGGTNLRLVDATTYPVGDGRYRLFLMDDAEEKDGNTSKDSNRTVVIRAYGWVGEAEAMIEAPYAVPVLTDFPGALVGCMENPDAKLWFGPKGGSDGGLGPGWPYVHWRIDGSYNSFGVPMPPILTSSTHPYRVNGFIAVRTGGGNPDFPNKWLFRHRDEPWPAGYQPGGPFFTWYGWADNSPPALSLDGSENVIDEGYRGAGNVDIGHNAPGNRPLGLYQIPRRVLTGTKVFSDPNGVTSLFGPSGRTLYKTPIIAFEHVYDGVAGYEKAEADFGAATYHSDDKGDAFAWNGIYGCPQGEHNEADYMAIGRCLTGSPLSTNAPAVGKGTVANNAGLAWNVIQTVLRKCSGSGEGARCCNAAGDGLSAACDGDYRALDNIAKCLILPANVKRDLSSFGNGVNGDNASYDDRTGASASSADDAPNATDKSWWPYPYQRYTVPSSVTSGWPAVVSGVAQKKLATVGLCESLYSAASSTVHPGGTPYYGYGSSVVCDCCTPVPGPICGRIMVKYCDREAADATYPNGKARAFVSGVWTWVDCNSESAWTGESCDDGYSMQPSDFFSGTYGGPWASNCATCNGFDWCDQVQMDGSNERAVCDDETEYDSYMSKFPNLDSKPTGNFTSCSDTCAFEWDPGADPAMDGAAAIAMGSDRGPPAVTRQRYWRSACINLDPHHVHKYGPANSPTQLRGERGSPHFIARLDLTDDGPMGSCNHVSAAHKITKDRGTCRSDGVNNFTLLGVIAPEFETLTDHPGKGLAALFSRTVDGQDSWLPATRTPTEFCSPGSGDADSLADLMNDIVSGATSVAVYNGWGGGADSTTQNGANCVYSTTKVNGVELGWYVEDCNDWGNYKIGAASPPGGVVCGCGILKVQSGGGGVAKLRLEANNTHEAIVWRGLVVFEDGSSGGGIDVNAANNNTKDYKKQLFVDGGFLGLVTSGNDIRVEAAKDPTGTGRAQVYVRFNQGAINMALAEVNLPLRGFRILY